MVVEFDKIVYVGDNAGASARRGPRSRYEIRRASTDSFP